MAKTFSLKDLAITSSPAAQPQQPQRQEQAVRPAPVARPSGTVSVLDSGDHELAMVPPPKSAGGALTTVQSRMQRTEQMFSAEAMETILVDMGVPLAHVKIAVARRQQTNETLAQIMRDFGFLSGEGVAKAVSRQTNFPYFDIKDIDLIRRSDFEGITINDFKRFIPVGKTTQGHLLIAVADASDVNSARNAYRGMPSEIVIASEHTIQTVYRKYFADTAGAVDRAIHDYTVAAKASRRVDEDDDSSLGLVRKVYFALIRHACYSGASDLYLYQSEFVGVVRLKVNGVGQVFRVLDLALHQRIMNKMVQDNSNPEELRLRPREGTIAFDEADQREYPDVHARFGFRLELAQSKGINSAVIRILDANSSATDLTQLPFDPSTLATLVQVSKTATGFFLVTGPTGSGKTTSLYALLKSIDAVARSVQSIENPIEYKHGLWQQFELRKDNKNEGEEYNEWLKALLRNAPDVILVGEVRDAHVAGICMDAANTGHLVFATLHTNSASMALARMKALKVDSNLLGSSLLGILAQRLLQTLCEDCAVDDNSEATRKELESASSYLGNVKFRPRCAGEGCENCDYTGYRGRRMIYELLKMTPAVREAVENDQSPSAIARIGMPEGSTIWASGMRLVAEGLTSVEELLRVANKA